MSTEFVLKDTFAPSIASRASSGVILHKGNAMRRPTYTGCRLGRSVTIILKRLASIVVTNSLPGGRAKGMAVPREGSRSFDLLDRTNCPSMSALPARYLMSTVFARGRLAALTKKEER